MKEKQTNHYKKHLKMKYMKNIKEDSLLIDRKSLFRRYFMRGLSMTLIVLGLWLLLTNTHKFSLGYGALRQKSPEYHTQSSDRQYQDDLEEHTKGAISTDKTIVKQAQISTEPRKVFQMQKKLKNLNQNTSEASEELYPVRPEIGEEIGELYIPSIEAVLPIFHGTNEDELDRGVGHYADSVLPGEKDNSVLSGHRDTIFRKLGEVGEGDLLIVQTSAGEFEYKVRKVRIVDEDDRTVIVPKPRATLTVSTCYPFYYVGPAPQRYVLEAYLIQ